MTSQEPTQPSDDQIADEVLTTPATPGAQALPTEAPDESDEAPGR